MMNRFLLLLLLPLVLTGCALADVTPAPASAPAANSLPTVSAEITPVEAQPAPPVEGSAGMFRLTIHPDLPEYTFRLRSNPDPYRLMDRRFMVGWIDVLGQDGAVSQEIPVSFVDAATAATWPELGLRALDINFDGYLDIAALEQGGATEGYWRWFVFQPEKAVFAATALADDLSTRPHNGVAADPESRMIYLHTLTGNCPGTFAYQVSADFLILAAKTETHPSDAGCVLVP